MAYLINEFAGHIEEDDYENGCLNESTFYKDIDIQIKADTELELLNKVSEFFDVEISDIEVNACDESGRLDVQRMENNEGEKATNNELELWKKGQCRLWLANYSASVLHVQNAVLKGVNPEKPTAGEIAETVEALREFVADETTELVSPFEILKVLNYLSENISDFANSGGEG